MRLSASEPARTSLLCDGVLRQADLHVGGHGHVHHLRVRQVQAVHQVDVFVDRLHLQPRIAAPLLADGADGVAFVVMPGVDEGLARHLQQAVEDRVILGPWVAILEIRAPGAADEQRVTREDAVGKGKGIGIVRMAGGEITSRLIPSMSSLSPSARRMDTTSALVFSPITVTQWVRSRRAPSPVTWSA